MLIIKLVVKRIVFIYLIISSLNNTAYAQAPSIGQQDNLPVVYQGNDSIKKTKKSFIQSLKNLVGNDISFLGSLGLAKQSVNDYGINSPVNYLYNTVNNNTFKPGFSAGFRIDGDYKKKHLYTFSVAINQISSGAKYKNKYTQSPFLEEFTRYKADNVFTTLSIAARYKKLLPISDMKKYKFYAVAGPSLDYKISASSNDNLLDGTANRLIVNADLGTEFDNNGYYVLFAHYKWGNNMFRSKAPVQLHRFELGISFKVKDIF